MKKKLLILMILPFFLHGQTYFSILSSKKNINEKIDALKKNKNSYTSTNLDSALYLGELIDSLAGLTSDIKIKSEALSDLALLTAGNDLAKAYECGFKNIEIVTKSKNDELIISAYLLMARLNYFNRQEEKIFEFLNKAIFVAEKSKKKELILLVYSKGQEFYASYFKYNESMDFLIKKSKLDTSLLHDPLYNQDLAGLYQSLKKNDLAEYYYQRALLIAENIKDTFRIVSLQIGYSVLLLKLDNTKRAIEFLKRGVILSEITKDKQSASNAIHYLAKAYFDNGDFINAKKNQMKLIDYNTDRKCNTCLIGEYRFLSEINVSLKNYQEAYAAIKKAYETYVEVNSFEATNDLRKVEINQINIEKQFEIDLSNKEKAAEKRIKNISFIALTISLIFIIGIIFSLFKIIKSKKIIALQQKETEVQKHLIEEKHREITDSINYAERIQRSFLATKEQLDEKLKDYFVLFQPKDVVSGDFYWAHTLHNGNFALVTADSTGHGVPGAIMSLLNTSSLEKAVELGINEPAEILNHTRQTIIQRLKKDGSADGGKDGMDCSLISFTSDKCKLVYSAANNPIWIIRENAMIELQPDKIPVGKHDRDSISFTQHEVDLQKGDMIYTLTDGFPDQFGGPKGKKFMYKKLKELLMSLAHKPTEEQQSALKSILADWMGNTEQVDDITIFGIRI